VNEASSAHPVTSSPRGLQVLILEPNEKVAAEIVSALDKALPGTKHAVARSLGEAQDLLVEQKPALFVLDVDATAHRMVLDVHLPPWLVNHEVITCAPVSPTETFVSFG